MSIRPKSTDAIEKMRDAGQVVAEVLVRLQEMARPGVATGDLDAEALRIITARGGRALFHGQPHPRGGRAYPGNICISLNEELVHGIPGPRRIAEGDERLDLVLLQAENLERSRAYEGALEVLHACTREFPEEAKFFLIDRRIKRVEKKRARA